MNNCQLSKQITATLTSLSEITNKQFNSDLFVAGSSRYLLQINVENQMGDQVVKINVAVSNYVVHRHTALQWLPAKLNFDPMNHVALTFDKSPFAFLSIRTASTSSCSLHPLQISDAKCVLSSSGVDIDIKNIDLMPIIVLTECACILSSSVSLCRVWSCRE